jgi:hypothetical protein
VEASQRLEVIPTSPSTHQIWHVPTVPTCSAVVSGVANVVTLIGLLPEPATLSWSSVRPSNTTFRLGRLTALHLSALYAASTVVGAGRESLARDVGESGTGHDTTPVPAAWSALAVTHRGISS